MRHAQRVGGQAIRVRGLVQGVGFRPTVWRLATECGLAGEVWNDAEGVMIRAWGEPDAIERFMRRVEDEAPPLARIDAIEEVPLEDGPLDATFHIVPSRGGVVQTGVVPDAATCASCLAEILEPRNRRHRYPFTNCTHCGPRLSILREVPYDRANTSMSEFALCRDCREEYDAPDDRRFHAQPTACPECGPHVWLESFSHNCRVSIEVGSVDDVEAASTLLKRGSIVAIKGLGGFHLACDACNGETVARMRARKRRHAKPFALMALSIDVVRRYCAVSAEEAALLRSTAAPIVILAATGPQRVAEAVAPGQATLGFMLPYTPLHHLLLNDFDRPLVMTSGNISEEPQCTDNDEARTKLAAIADYGLFHDRAIVNRVDDSVVRVVDCEGRSLRRARGYAPAPLTLPKGFKRAPPVLALGGELKNTFCLIKEGQAILSQHMGDLEDASTFADYRRAISLYGDLFDFKPGALTVDLHPEYLSSKLGRDWAARNSLRIEEVQHHHAHIASCLAENGVPLATKPILGVALDGLGAGPDGTLWGGEFLLADYTRFERLGCFPPVAMPGGALAVRQPWRNTYVHLATAIGWEQLRQEYAQLDLIRFLVAKPLATLQAMMNRGINSPLSSSCGRLFDAVAAAIGICREEVSYEGQAAIELEACVDESALAEEAGYPITVEMAQHGAGTRPLPTLKFCTMWQALLADLVRGSPAGVMAACFHLGLARAVVEMVLLLFEREGERLTRSVALTGGSFQNRLLLERVSRSLAGEGLTVLTHTRVPANDGGLSLGQAAIAAARSIRAEQGLTREDMTCA